MRVVFLSPSGRFSGRFSDYKSDSLLGVETQINGLARELSKRGYEIYVVRRWHTNNLEPESVDDVALVNIADSVLSRVSNRPFLQELMYSRLAANETRKIGPDITILPDMVSSFFFTDLHMPKIYVTHNPQSDMLDGNFLRRSLRKRMERRLFAKCDVIVTLNSSTQRYFESEGYNVELIPNGVNESDFKFESDDAYVLNSGRQIPHKHLDLLIKAYSMLLSDLQDKYSLIFAGEGPEHTHLRQLAAHQGVENVQFIPRLAKTEYLDIISRCSVFVLPTSLEGFGTVTIEAMACSKPVIVSDIAAPRDIIDDGHSGFLFKNLNADDLSRVLQECLSDSNLRRKIGANARRVVEERYSFQKVAEKYISLFDRLAV